MRESRSSQRRFCHSSGAGDTRGRRPQTPHGFARRHGRRQTGLPHPEHGGAGLGSLGNPRFPSEPARHRVPAHGSSQEQAKGPRCLREPESL